MKKNDLISREDAIDAICKEWCYVTYGNCPHVDDGFTCDGCDDVKAIKSLPSAEIPTESTNTPTNTQTDLISREEAIQAVRKIVPVEVDVDATLLDKAEVILELSALPSADTDMSDYSDRLWKTAYERGKAEASAEPRTGNCSEKPTGWIPCSERLPSVAEKFTDGVFDGYVYTCYESECVLVQGVYRGFCGEPIRGMFTAIYSEYSYDDGKVETLWRDNASGDLEYEATAWMPLPKPYKESEVEE